MELIEIAPLLFTLALVAGVVDAIAGQRRKDAKKNSPVALMKR